MVGNWVLFFNGGDNYELLANEEQIYFQLLDGTITQEKPKQYTTAI